MNELNEEDILKLEEGEGWKRLNVEIWKRNERYFLFERTEGFMTPYFCSAFYRHEIDKLIKAARSILDLEGGSDV